MESLYAMAGGGGAGAEGGLGGLGALIPFVLIFVVFYFLLIRPQRQKEQEHKKMLDALKREDKVVTNGGIYGTIVDIKDRKIVLEVAKGVRIEILKGAIGNKVK